MLERSILDDERLQPLAELYGPLAVRSASIEVLGFPPWQLSTSELLKVVEYLESQKS